MSRPRKRIVFETQAPTAPGAPATLPSSIRSSSTSTSAVRQPCRASSAYCYRSDDHQVTQLTREESLAWALPILFAFVSGYYEDLPKAFARRSKLARVCKTVNIVLSWPLISTLACRSTTALSLIIVTCAAIACLLPNATELPAQPWDAGLATLHSCALYCVVRVLQAVLHELQVAGKAREEEGRAQIQHSVRRQCAVRSETLA